MKRILLVTTSYPVAGEGEAAAGTFVRDFALTLAAEGLEVEVVAPTVAPTHPKANSPLMETLFQVPKQPLSLLRPSNPADWPAIVKTLRNGYRAVHTACESRRPDHIFALWALPSGDWARRAGKRFNIPYSTWALGSDIWSLGKIPLLRQYLAKTLRDAALRFADGYQLSTDVETICGQPCQFLPSSRKFCDSSNRRLAQNAPFRLAFLGRWHPNKGIDLLLGALMLLDDKDWGAIEAVRICGGGPLEQIVQRQVTLLQTAGRPVELMGYLNQAEAKALFDWTDFVIIPSRIESIPVVFSDAMQAQRPVIAMPVGDLPKVIASLNCGLLVPSISEAALAKTIRHALNSSTKPFTQGLSDGAISFDIVNAARLFLKQIG